jgi:GntR family transcriptional repressor for pyruvate dehydrogenase complex
LLTNCQIYGILKTFPQSATCVASPGVKALEGLIANALALDQNDIDSLLETREILKINAARLAAIRADQNDLEELIDAHEIYKKQIQEQGVGMADDLFFHLKVAECSKNTELCL